MNILNKTLVASFDVTDVCNSEFSDSLGELEVEQDDLEALFDESTGSDGSFKAESQVALVDNTYFQVFIFENWKR